MSDVYTPSPWGERYHALTTREAFGGGAAGPGKSLVLMHDADQQIAVEHERCLNKDHPYHQPWGASKGWAIHLRRTYKMLAETIARAKRQFPLIDPGVRWVEDDLSFFFTSGFRFQFGHCKDPDDWNGYFSFEFTHVAFDELPQFTQTQYDMIKSRCRTDDPVLIHMRKVRAMGNPTIRRDSVDVRDDYIVDDPHWVRNYFIDPCREGNTILKRKVIMGDGSVEWHTRIFLPARLSDNPNAQFRREYELTLRSLKPHMKAALLDGNWYVVFGSFYADYWEEKRHVCKPFKIPPDWPRWRSMDWGFKKPGCVHWWTMDPDGNVFCTSELMFQGKLDRQVAEMIRHREEGWGLWHGKRSRINGVADTQLWEKRGDSAKSKAETMHEFGVDWLPADKSEGSRRRHAQILCAYLQGETELSGDEAKHLTEQQKQLPSIAFFEGCDMAIQTIPAIPSVPGDPDMPRDGGDDHAHDSVLYSMGLVSRGRKAIPKMRPLSKADDDDFEAQPVVKKRRTGSGYG